MKTKRVTVQIDDPWVATMTLRLLKVLVSEPNARGLSARKAARQIMKQLSITTPLDQPLPPDA